MPLPSRRSKYVFWVLNALLGAAFLADLFVPRFATGLEPAMVALAAAASIAALNRGLPLQNILPIAVISACAGGLAHGLSANPNLSMPLGPIVFNPAAGGKIFHFVPWTIPLLWIVAIFNARGVGRLILRPWRKVKNYGYWLIALTAVLTTLFDFALEPFAWHVRHLWLWQQTKVAVTWQGATLLNFIGWAFVSLLILLFATPFLIRKQPGAATAPDFHPLAVWLGALVLFATGYARTGLWWPLAMDAAVAGVTAVLAVRGARW